MRFWFIMVFKSISTNFKLEPLYSPRVRGLVWIRHRPSKSVIVGSNPTGPALLIVSNGILSIQHYRFLNMEKKGNHNDLRSN